MIRRTLAYVLSMVAVVASAITAWIAYPTQEALALAPPLAPWSATDALEDAYSQDFPALAAGFKPQKYRSFCGPASIATILRAYGLTSADQSRVFPSIGDKLDVFYSGMTLRELAALAENSGLSTETLYADSLSLDAFRERLKQNLQRMGDYALINYDRRVLSQSGAGHISAIGAYDSRRDAFLILDQASYKYPFHWAPTQLLYQAARTKDGDLYRGLLIVHGRQK